MGEARERFEQRSVPLLRALSRAPRWALLLGVLALMLGSAVLPPPLALLCLLAMLGLAAWLTALSWPALSGPARSARVGLLLMVLLLVGGRLQA